VRDLPICSVCGKTLKNPNSKSHIQSKFHQDALRRQKGLSDAEVVSDIAKTKPTGIRASAQIEKRVSLLEEQIRFIMNKLTAIDLKLSQGVPSKVSPSNLNLIKKELMKLIPRGQSMTIDKIASSLKFPETEWKTIEQAIIDLVDDEVFDVSEGRSHRKVAGNIGRLIRR